MNVYRKYITASLSFFLSLSLRNFDGCFVFIFKTEKKSFEKKTYNYETDVVFKRKALFEIKKQIKLIDLRVKLGLWKSKRSVFLFLTMKAIDRVHSVNTYCESQKGAWVYCWQWKRLITLTAWTHITWKSKSSEVSLRFGLDINNERGRILLSRERIDWLIADKRDALCYRYRLSVILYGLISICQSLFSVILIKSHESAKDYGVRPCRKTQSIFA